MKNNSSMNGLSMLIRDSNLANVSLLLLAQSAPLSISLPPSLPSLSCSASQWHSSVLFVSLSQALATPCVDVRVISLAFHTIAVIYVRMYGYPCNTVSSPISSPISRSATSSLLEMFLTHTCVSGCVRTLGLMNPSAEFSWTWLSKLSTPLGMCPTLRKVTKRGLELRWMSWIPWSPLTMLRSVCRLIGVSG